MTRDEHVAWCRRRALEYVSKGDVALGMASLVSDLNKHRDTRPSMALVNSAMTCGYARDAAMALRFLKTIK